MQSRGTSDQAYPFRINGVNSRLCLHCVNRLSNINFASQLDFLPDCSLKSARRLSSVCLLSQRVRGPHASRADVTTVSGRDFHFSPHHGGCESEGPGGRQFIICPSPLPGPVTGGTGRHMCAWITSNPPIDGASPSACLPLPLPVRRFDTQEGEHGVLGVSGSIKAHIYSVHQANSRNKTTILNKKKKRIKTGELWSFGLAAGMNFL